MNVPNMSDEGGGLTRGRGKEIPPRGSRSYDEVNSAVRRKKSAADLV